MPPGTQHASASRGWCWSSHRRHSAPLTLAHAPFNKSIQRRGQLILHLLAPVKKNNFIFSPFFLFLPPQCVLQAYDAVRRPRANSVLVRSYACGEIYEHAGPSGGSLEGLRHDLTGIWEFVWHHDLDEDYRAAVRFLVDKRAFDAM